MQPPNKKIRVLIVDDSAFICRVLREIISSDPQMEVVGQAKDGRDAVAMTQSMHPDVITMDINMPHMDGLQATELIMSQNPRPILVVSSASKEGAASTLRALELGAIDFVGKPSSGVDLDMKSVSDELLRKLKLAAKVRVVRTAARPKIPSAAVRVEHPPAAHAVSPGTRFPIVMIAASTGGPATLMRLVPNLPRGLAAAIILVLHMPPSFTSQFSLQLAEVTGLRVKEAKNSETLQPGTLYVCPGSHHMRLSSSGKISLDNGPRIAGYRPCASLTMETAAANFGVMTIAVVLTGMGDDAAEGVKAVKAAGGYVIAQDEATAVIFGMPQEAIKTGAVDKVLPLDEIGPAIEKRVAQLNRLAPVGAR